MKKSKLFKTVSICILIATACNKTQVGPPKTTTSSSVKRIAVKQTFRNVPLDRTKDVIARFEITEQSNTTSKSFLPDTDVTADSSIWALETSLNYHFDKSPGDHDFYMDSAFFDAPITTLDGVNYIITPADLNIVYDQFKASITQKTAGQQRVKIIDITAYIDPALSKIFYKGDIVIAVKSPPPSCSPFATSAGWSGWICTSAPFGDILCENRLNNCAIFDCPNLFYQNVALYQPNYTVISTPLFKVTNYPGLCPTASSSALNSTYSQCQSIAAANRPTVNHIATNYDILPNQQPGSVIFTYNSWYGLKIIYGQPFCFAGNPN